MPGYSIRINAVIAITLACGFARTAPAQQPPASPPPATQHPLRAQPRVPFELDANEQKRIDALLITWEQQSDKVKSFKCQFTRWDYDDTWGPKNHDKLLSMRFGEIKFKAPDNGTFKEVKMEKYDEKSDSYVETKEDLEHWVCDGTAIYQFKPKVKTLEVIELPKEMRGKAITDGPLPFVFGAKAKTLKERYWIRETTPKALVGKQIWLEAWPKHAQQAADFQRVEVILSLPNMLPVAMQIATPNGKDKTAYEFGDKNNPPLVNNMWEGIKDAFAPPMLPPFWKKVVVPASAPTAETPASKGTSQARRPTESPIRK